MPQHSAGIFLYRRRGGAIEVLLVHPGGPFWARKDEGAWSIPKGEYAADEDPLAAARREFAEETGTRIEGEAIALGAFRQSSAKTVDAWAIEGDFDPATLKSNTFYHGMAAALRQDARGSGGGPRPVVHARGGRAQAPQGPAPDP